MAIPIVCTGRGEPVGAVLSDTMKPDYEVIHFVLAGSLKDELPSLLQGKKPDNPSNSTIGTGNFAAPPQALVLGAGYQQEDIDKLQALAASTPGAVQIPWLWVHFGQGDLPTTQPTPEEIKAIGAKVAVRMREFLDKLKAEGKLGDGNPGVHKV